MSDWRRKKIRFTRKQVTYELEQLFILRQGFEQGYAFQESLQCMAAFCPTPEVWPQLVNQIQTGAPVQVLLTSLHFRPKTIGWLCGDGEWQDLAQAVHKTVQLLEWEVQVRSQLQKTFAYPVVMVLILTVFGSGFSFFVLPQLAFLQLEGTIWLFALPNVLTITTVSGALVGFGSWWWWRRADFVNRCRIWRVLQRIRLFQLWYCLRLALHCQLNLGQGRAIAEVFADVSQQQRFFSQLLTSMHEQLRIGLPITQVFTTAGFSDPTWLSFFQWQPTNQQVIIASEFYWQHAFRQLQATIERACQIGQTLFFLGIGFVLIQFYLSLFLPIFELTSQF